MYFYPLFIKSNDLRLPGNISYFFKAKENHFLPEVFDNYLLNTDLQPYSVLKGDNYRKQLLSSGEKITVKDFGAGSHKMKSPVRFVSDIVKISGSKPEFGHFYQKLIQYFEISNILELGTSAGIGTMYLSTATESVKVTGIEACPQTCSFLSDKLKENGIGNVSLINNDFDSVFDSDLLAFNKFDMVFIDGNHRGSSLLKYFDLLQAKYVKDKYVVIVDDINWSKDMYRAWKKITGTDNSKTYLNLFRCGVILSGYDLPGGKFSINFVNNQSM